MISCGIKVLRMVSKYCWACFNNRVSFYFTDFFSSHQWLRCNAVILMQSHTFLITDRSKACLFTNHFFRCKYHAGTIGSGQTVELPCSNPVAGRYVYLTLRVTEYLTLCEVEVFEAKGNVLPRFILMFGLQKLWPLSIIYLTILCDLIDALLLNLLRLYLEGFLTRYARLQCGPKRYP